MLRRSCWIPGSYAPALSEKCNSLLRLLKNKGFKEESMTKVGVYALDTSTTLESNKSLGTMFKRWDPDIEVGELAEAASSPASPCSRTFPTFVSATRGKLSAAGFAPSATTAAGASAYRPASAARSLRECPAPRLKTACVPHRQGAFARRRRCGQIRRARPALRRPWCKPFVRRCCASRSAWA